MTFQDNPVLGKFTEGAAPLDWPKKLADLREELKAAYEHIAELTVTLEECREYLENHVDVVDGENGPLPNAAMKLVSQIDEVL